MGSDDDTNGIQGISIGVSISIQEMEINRYSINKDRYLFHIWWVLTSSKVIILTVLNSISRSTIIIILGQFL